MRKYIITRNKLQEFFHVIGGCKDHRLFRAELYKIVTTAENNSKGIPLCS